MRNLRWAMLSALLVTGCRAYPLGAPGGDGRVENPGPAPAGSELQFAVSEPLLQNGYTVQEVNLFGLSELWVRVLTPLPPKESMLRLDVYNGRNVKVYSDESIFTLDPAGGTAMHPGMGTEVAMNVVKSTLRGSALDRCLPVAGTPIVRYFEEGDWHVEATIDGVPGIISAPLRVTLTR